MSECHHDSSRERGGVDQVSAAERAGISDGVGQDEPAFRVGVQDFDGLAGSEVTMSPGRWARLPGMFSTAGSGRVTGMLGLSCAIARIAPIMAAPPAMSYFIFSMPSAGLIEMPPVSKVTPLPTKPKCTEPLDAVAGR